MAHVAVVPFGTELREAKHDESVKLSVLLEEKVLKYQKFCSFEVFSSPKMTKESYQELFSELESCFPLFYSITWHEAPTCKIPTETHQSLKYFENFSNITLLHLPAKGLSRSNVMHILNRAVELGRVNIFALQGDLDNLDRESNAIDFPHAIDLVKFIRAEFGSKFSICVAGYPQMHPKSPSKNVDLFYLKAKVDAGANFIITQMVFESKVFIEFVSDCRRIGITVPIIPGVFLISNFSSTMNVLRNIDVRIPERIQRDLELLKHDEFAIEEYGINSAASLIQEIFESGTASGFHLFTINRWHSALELCKCLGLCKVRKPLEGNKSPPIGHHS